MFIDSEYFKIITLLLSFKTLILIKKAESNSASLYLFL